MKKIFKIILVLVLLLSFVRVFAHGLDDANDPSIPSLNPDDLLLNSFFIKQDENGNLIDEAVFRQITSNGNVILDNITVSRDNNSNSNTNPENNPLGISGKYKYIDRISDEDLIFSMLTPDQKEIINSLKTLDDYYRIKENHLLSDAISASCGPKDEAVKYYKKSKGIFIEEVDLSAIITFNSNNVKRLQATNSLGETYGLGIAILNYNIIEEIKTPKGLEKTSIVLPMMTELLFRISNNNLVLIQGVTAQWDKLALYDPSINYNDIADVIEKTTNNMIFTSSCGQSQWFSLVCGNQTPGDTDNGDDFDKSKIPDFLGDNSDPNGICYSTVVDKTSTEDLSKKVKLNSYVNGKKSVTVKKGEEVDISVKINNESKTPLYTNRVTSSIPKGFKLVEGSISNGGVYNSNDNTVSWEFDYLDSLADKTFSYKAKAPSNFSEGSSVKTTASLSVNESDKPIIFDEANVDLGNKIVNPKTGNIVEKILLLALTICGFVVVALIGKNRITQI